MVCYGQSWRRFECFWVYSKFISQQWIIHSCKKWSTQFVCSLYSLSKYWAVSLTSLVWTAVCCDSIVRCLFAVSSARSVPRRPYSLVLWRHFRHVWDLLVRRLPWQRKQLPVAGVVLALLSPSGEREATPITHVVPTRPWSTSTLSVNSLRRI